MSSFLHLFGHRFASHCCEALFLQSAAVVTQELIGHVQEKREAAGHSEPSVSMEDLFLDTIKELEGSLGYLMTDKFSSHVFRVLLVVLSGRPLATTTTSILQSKKKERVAISNLTPGLSEHIKVRRTVPSSFTKALTGMLSGTLVGLDTGYLRALASHPIGNPVLQLLLEIEFAGSGRQNTRDANSLFRRLIPDESAEDSAHFIKGILYDPVGSRLLETIIQHAPGKTFRALYQSLFRDSMGNLVRNDIAAFVVIKILERLGRDELSHAAEQIYGEIPTLIDRSRTAIAKTLIERSEVRQLDTRPVADALIASYGADGGQRLAHMLQFEDSDASGMANERKPQREAGNTNQLHGSLLVQAMLESPGRLREMVMSDLLEMDSTMLVRLSKDRTATHVIQKSLTCTDQDKPFRQKLIQKLHGHVADLASDAVSSHVVDAFWTATRDIRFIRERLAEELLENQWAIKETFPGRAVFRNWKMDLYRRRKLEWIKISAGSGDVGSAAAAKHVPNGRSGIELAREKFAASKTGIRRGVGRGSGGMAATARGSTAS
jgi:nucleolar protein 9